MLAATVCQAVLGGTGDPSGSGNNTVIRINLPQYPGQAGPAAANTAFTFFFLSRSGRATAAYLPAALDWGRTNTRYRRPDLNTVNRQIISPAGLTRYHTHLQTMHQVSQNIQKLKKTQF